MADKKMTRKEALELAVEHFTHKLNDYLKMSEADEISQQYEEAIEVFTKMIASLDKQAAKPKGKTTARIQNEGYMKELYRLMQEHKEPVTPKWVTEHVKGVMSTQRVVWVAKIGKEWGWIKEIRVKKDVFYALIDWEPPTE